VDVKKAHHILTERSLLNLSRSFHPEFSEHDPLFEAY
jgi:hypothetical protein